MKKHLLTVATLMWGTFTAAGQNTNPPNIIVFLVDDMGWQDTSVPFASEKTPFNKRYRTPNMERLASQGVKFTQAYASAVSSPTRVSLLTGMNAARHRVTNWTLHRNASNDGKSDTLIYPKWNINGLSAYPGIENTVYATPLPELLRQNGYHTIHCGKAHLGAIGTPGADPLTLGYNVNVAGHAAGAQGSYLGEANYGNDQLGPWGVPDMEDFYGHNVFLTEALTLKALRELDKAKDTKRPFFLSMSHYAVHIPFAADERFADKYRKQGLSETEAQYASLIEGMDKSLGDIMDYLTKTGLDNNTVILFMSDNGGLSAHKRDGLHIHNKPLASGKGSAYEGGIRVPMIVKWPQQAKAGTVCDQYVIIEDYFPSLLELAGVKTPKTIQHVDGLSFVPLLKGETVPKNRALFWHYPNNWGVSGPGIGASSTIRKNDWKLIYYHQNNQFELFNLDKDLGEQNNVASKEKQVVLQLAKELEDYLKTVDAQMPFNKITNTEVAFPYTWLLNN